MNAIGGEGIFQQSVLPFDDDECDGHIRDVANRIADVLSPGSGSQIETSIRPRVVDATKYSLDKPLVDPSSSVVDASDDVQPTAEDADQGMQFTPVPSSVEQPSEIKQQTGSKTRKKRYRDDGPRVPFQDQLQTFCGAHAGVLYRSLEYLLWATSPTSERRREIVEWIFTETVEYTDTKDGKKFRVPARDFPFSFVNCCIAEGIDADYARDRIWDLLEGRRKGEPIRLASLH